MSVGVEVEVAVVVGVAVKEGVGMMLFVGVVKVSGGVVAKGIRLISVAAAGCAASLHAANRKTAVTRQQYNDIFAASLDNKVDNLLLCPSRSRFV